jgi:hypothetical protein
MVENKTTSRKIPRVLYASDDEDMSDVELETPVTPVETQIENPLGEAKELPVAPLSEPIRKKGRPKKAPDENATTKKVEPKKREHDPMECKFCGKKYTQSFSLNKHINDNRCYVKREQDKAEIERIKALATLPPPPPEKPKKQKKAVIESEVEPVVKKPRQKKEKVLSEVKPPQPPPPTAPVVPLVSQAPKAKYLFKFN